MNLIDAGTYQLRVDAGYSEADGGGVGVGLVTLVVT